MKEDIMRRFVTVATCLVSLLALRNIRNNQRDLIAIGRARGEFAAFDR